MPPQWKIMKTMEIVMMILVCNKIWSDSNPGDNSLLICVISKWEISPRVWLRVMKGWWIFCYNNNNNEWWGCHTHSRVTTWVFLSLTTIVLETEDRCVGNLHDPPICGCSSILSKYPLLLHRLHWNWLHLDNQVWRISTMGFSVSRTHTACKEKNK